MKNQIGQALHIIKLCTFYIQIINFIGQYIYILFINIIRNKNNNKIYNNNKNYKIKINIKDLIYY